MSARRRAWFNTKGRWDANAVDALALLQFKGDVYVMAEYILDANRIKRFRACVHSKAPRWKNRSKARARRAVCATLARAMNEQENWHEYIRREAGR